jgi:hypothetical protein
MGRALALSITVSAVCAAFAAGCDAGGLLVVESSVDAGTDAGPVVLGPGANDFVGAGTVASNAKYRIVYSLGQATPNQEPAKGTSGQLNGGLIGATESK